VPWNFNLQSDRLLPGLEYLLISVSPWRLALLFFISGVASCVLLDKLTPGRFVLDRFKRLFVVLLLGMWVINPIQVYVEFLDKGLIEAGYIRFWAESYARAEISRTGVCPPGITCGSCSTCWSTPLVWLCYSS
jgi:glucans biosynthesis protein C